MPVDKIVQQGLYIQVQLTLKLYHMYDSNHCTSKKKKKKRKTEKLFTIGKLMNMYKKWDTERNSYV